jgi:arylsulfatase A-like enzyme
MNQDRPKRGGFFGYDRFCMPLLNRRQFLAPALASPFVPQLVRSAERPPNVILILTDDQGWYEIGVNGNTDIHTPAMDKLASEGVRFTQFYSSPVCAPTRASLMTGRHYQRTGAVDTYLGRDTLHSDEVTLGQVLQRQGYRTACIGKWHLGRYMKYHPLNRGFDEFFGFWQYGFINRYDDSDELWSGKERVQTRGYVTDVLTDRALSFIEQNQRKPFFLYLPYNAPHVPHLAPDPFISKYLKQGLPLAEARIYGMIESLDTNIGRVLQKVDSLGLRDNTMVLFMSDNGGVGRFNKAGMRGFKGSCYEGGVRVPFFARWPGKFPAGAVTNATAQHIDVLPTLCDLTGAAKPNRPLDGKSLAPLLREGKGESPHDFLFHQWNRGHPVLDTVPGDSELQASWAVRDARGRKLMATGELFDLSLDPSEAQNIAGGNPETVRALRSKMEEWFSDVTKGQRYSRVPIEVGRKDENPVEIDLTWGDPIGKRVRPLYRSYNLDIVDQWDTPGDAVRWDLEVVQGGVYEVTLNYGCRIGDGGKVKIEAGGSVLEHEPQPTAGREVFRPLTCGTIQLRRGPVRLTLTAETVRGEEIMALHKIWLRRLEP